MAAEKPGITGYRARMCWWNPKSRNAAAASPPLNNRADPGSVAK